MDNYFATTMQPQKKKADVFAMVVGAILALGFLLSTILSTVGFFMDLEYYIDCFKFEYGFNFEGLIDAIFNPTTSLFEIFGLFLLALYCGIALIMKGKKLRAFFILGFVALFLSYSWWVIDELAYLIRNASWMFEYGAADVLYDVFWLLFYIFTGASAFMGIICGIFKKKAPSAVFGIIGAILSVLALCSYICARFYPMIMKFDWWGYDLVPFIVFTVATIVSLVSITGVFLFLRPTKKQ